MPSASLEIVIWVFGLQMPPDASTWYFSPVAGSLRERGTNCANAGAASSRTAGSIRVSRATVLFTMALELSGNVRTFAG